MKVIKFGGTSVGEVHAIEQICYILIDKKEQEDRYAIIVSAIGGITDQLVICAQYAEKKNIKYYLILDEIESYHLEIIRELFTILHKKKLISRIIKYLKNLEKIYNSICKITYFSKVSLDKIMNFGELISSFIISEKLKASGFPSKWKDSRNFIMKKSIQVNLDDVKSLFINDNTPYIILPGFIAAKNEKEIATLGRGGSDFTASIFSASIQSEYMEIYSDVSGIMTVSPKIVSKAFPVKNISYREAIEISYLGAEILYPPTLLTSMKKNIPIIILNTFSPLEMGTLIFSTFKTKSLITVITGMKNITFLSLKRKLGMPGYFNQFAALSSNDIFHVLINQSSSELCIENKILSEFTNDMNHPFSVDKELCIISIIVSNIKNISVTSGYMFSALGKESIKPNVIGSTEKNIYAVIAKKYFKLSIKFLHDIYFDNHYKKVHIFMAGLGQVGSKLIEQLNKQKEYLVEELHIQIRVIGICNSKKMFFDILGINLNNWQKNLKLGTPMIIEEFLGNLYNLNLRNSIFIDNTASKEISHLYDDILGKGIGVVTCNKIACASSYHEYKNIKNLSRYFKAPFFFEPNVGAGLPVINTLNSLIESGDKIHLIESVLSGSFNFILTQFGSFIDIVRETQKKGLTEPDTRIDLSGIDVIRKILILGRECGDSIELEDIKQISLLTKSSIKAFTVDNFYQELIYNEEFFTKRSLVAKEQRKRLRFIAKYKYGESYVGLKYIEFQHQFYHLESKDNMILYTTDRYSDLPLLVKGAGAGAEVTASGIFTDIIKASI
ncbi:bifunctional aspartokinase/homoserine dehydrogenase [Candidatus Uzinura diaspidicola str. ASNER]|uniref:Bifunctional aspartokinase/homoserine dehydrogenase n=1 Tax=Candidatus Uzinura diaspidicola str. ASNER TaxID=1133592 RepID=L7VJR1_9FLAO|nr:bifunctional aspartokinase/homoserine dehydrogenase [Candidatus Uzinura diaspidicola str. ASNER]